MPKKVNVARLVELSTPEASGATPLLGAERSPVPFVGECTDTRHPVLSGRVCVRWAAPEGAVERWVPALRGLGIRERDRVLLIDAVDELEPIVIGVIDGFQPRPAESRVGPMIALQVDEVLSILAENGAPLLEIAREAEGPVVRLLQKETHIELPGLLRIQAAEIELSAQRGSVRIEADDDVVVRGEMVRLN